MTKTEPRWIVYDLEWKEDDGRKVSKICLIGYSPDDNTDPTSKFVYANSMATLKAKIPEINLDKVINSYDDLTAEAVKAWFK